MEQKDRNEMIYDKAADYVRSLEEKLSRKPTACSVCFGCQMNARDSEKLSGILRLIGYELTEDEDADLVIYNTCTVRDNADQRVYGRLGAISSMKKRKPWMKVILCGCMMQEGSAIEKIKKSYPFVDLIFGTFNLDHFPELLCTMFENEGSSSRMIVDIWKEAHDTDEDLPTLRKYPFKQGINIMYGCDNYCTYCIVPYVRGRERSRDPRSILREIEKAASEGVKEIMLLGQNVDSYGKTLSDQGKVGMDFPELLREVAHVEGIRRVRFMTSHPKDFSDEVLQVIADEPVIARHIHLPMQSGSDAILKKMNRHYDMERYMDIVRAIRRTLPDAAITTDIITGFPGETESDVDATVNAVKEAGFENAFTFIYSRRTGTPAASMPLPPKEFVTASFDRVLKTVQETARERTLRYTGSTAEVLVEEMNDHMDGYLTGRMSNNMLVHFPGTCDLIGSFINVELTECRGFYYTGRLSQPVTLAQDNR